MNNIKKSFNDKIKKLALDVRKKNIEKKKKKLEKKITDKALKSNNIKDKNKDKDKDININKANTKTRTKNIVKDKNKDVKINKSKIEKNVVANKNSDGKTNEIFISLKKYFSKIKKYFSKKRRMRKKKTKVFFTKLIKGENKKVKKRKKLKRKLNKEKITFRDIEDYSLIVCFSFIILGLFLSIVLPFEESKSHLIISNLTDTEDMNGIKKVEEDLNNVIKLKTPFYSEILKGYFGASLMLNEGLYVNANDNDLILIDAKNMIYTDKNKSRLIRNYKIKDRELEMKSRITLFDEIADGIKKLNENKSPDRITNMYIYAVSNIWNSEAILNFDVDIKTPLADVEKFSSSIDSWIKFDYLKIIDYTTYQKYFFKTDHHWAIQGAYEAYKDLYRMFGFTDKEKMIKPEFFLVNDKLKFIGSNGRLCAFDSIYDQLYDVKFDEKYNVKLNGKKIKVKELSNKELYKNGKIFEEMKKQEFYNHYGSYFHSDKGEIIYTFNKNKDTDRNLLIISDSYSNCMEQLIASHFYNTCVIDLRYYESSLGKKFDIYEYIEDNDITDVLFMLSCNSIYYESTKIEVDDYTRTNGNKVNK